MLEPLTEALEVVKYISARRDPAEHGYLPYIEARLSELRVPI
tara:strand:- start:378 stop:503 length:126 start_codon:yes stop_codon:yes gene_type:complete